MAPVGDIDKVAAVPHISRHGHVRIQIIVSVKIGSQLLQQRTRQQVAGGGVGHVPQTTPVIVDNLHVIQ